MRDISSIDDIEFVHIPKNGGTTIQTHLSTVDPLRFSVIRPHATAWQMRAKDAIAFDRRFSFAIVRNPYQRCISIWQHCLRRQLSILKRSNGFANEQEKTLWKTYHDFNIWFEDNFFQVEWDLAYMAVPQWHWVSNWDSVKIVNRIWRLEDLADCVVFLNGQLGQNFDTSLIENAAIKSYSYRDITTEKTKQAMIELCKLDCKEFGYEW